MKGIPCRSRAGFMDFGDNGESYMEHWVNEYWDFQENGRFCTRPAAGSLRISVYGLSRADEQ